MSNALNTMSSVLAEKEKASQEQDWLKSRQNTFAEKISGEFTTEELCQNSITFIAEYIQAHIGTIYVRNDNQEFQLTSSYAFKKRKNLSNSFKPGEGIIGQCALEKKTFILSNVPDDYIKISCGLGESTPLNILVAPLLADNEIIGVIELASLHEITDLQMQFLENISGILAVALRTSSARVRMQQLLMQTQMQAEEMDLQREQLRVINEELTAKQQDISTKNKELEKTAAVLRDSEAELQAQQEELRQTNEELEEKTETLKNFPIRFARKTRNCDPHKNWRNNVQKSWKKPVNINPIF